jgi:hypothetical protein
MELLLIALLLLIIMWPSSDAEIVNDSLELDGIVCSDGRGMHYRRHDWITFKKQDDTEVLKCCICGKEPKMDERQSFQTQVVCTVNGTTYQ